MRSAAGLIVVFALAVPASAQTARYEAEVVAETATVRAGPGAQMPETGTLSRGTRVIVDHEEGDSWVAVEAPRGQLSWINHKFIGPAPGQPETAVPRRAIVHAEPDAELTVGRMGTLAPLDVRRTRVPNGSFVTVTGNAVKHGGSTWYPIEPPDGDFRYLPRSAVQMRGKATQSFVVKDVPDTGTIRPAKGSDTLPPAALPVPGSGTPVAVKTANWPNHPLWLQGDQAERDGDYDRAVQLYLKLAAEMNRAGGDAELANLCYSRVHTVREKQRQVKTDPGRWTGRVTAGPNGEGRWVGPGKLREAGLKFDQRATYAIESAQGRVLCYVVAGPNIGLKQYLGSDVEVYGTIDHPGDLRGAGVMTAASVRLAR